MNYWKWKMGVFVLVMGLILVFGFLWLWNWLMPSIFGLPAIDLPEALGLLALSRILFGSWGGKKHSHSKHPKSFWMHKMRRKWKNMTPEQREKFKDNWSWCVDDREEEKEA